MSTTLNIIINKAVRKVAFIIKMLVRVQRRSDFDTSMSTTLNIIIIAAVRKVATPIKITVGVQHHSDKRYSYIASEIPVIRTMMTDTYMPIVIVA